MPDPQQTLLTGTGGEPTGGEPSGSSGEPLAPYMSQLKKDFWQNEELAKLGDTNGLAAAYLKAIEGNGEQPPTNAEGYEYPDAEVPDDLKELVSFTDALKGDFGKAALELGLTKSQVAGLYKWYTGATIQGVRDRHAGLIDAKNKLEGQLREEYGTQLPSAKAKMARAFEKYGGAETAKYMIDTGLGNDPFIVRMFINIGQDMVEKETPGNEEPTGGSEIPEERFAKTGGQRRIRYKTDE